MSDPIAMDETKLLLLEIDYTQWDVSCRDPHLTPDGQLVECRRQKKHDNTHATRAGFRAITWENQ